MRVVVRWESGTREVLDVLKYKKVGNTLWFKIADGNERRLSLSQVKYFVINGKLEVFWPFG